MLYFILATSSSRHFYLRNCAHCRLAAWFISPLTLTAKWPDTCVRPSVGYSVEGESIDDAVWRGACCCLVSAFPLSLYAVEWCGGLPTFRFLLPPLSCIHLGSVALASCSGTLALLATLFLVTLWLLSTCVANPHFVSRTGSLWPCNIGFTYAHNPFCSIGAWSNSLNSLGYCPSLLMRYAALQQHCNL